MTERRKKKTKSSSQVEYRENLKPITKGHADYIRSMSENIVTFCTGPAGCSKSYSVLGLASQYLLEEKVERIIIARPAIEASKKGIGFLPGGLQEKFNPYVQPAIEHLQRFLGRNTYSQLRASDRIRMEPLEFLRGKTFDNSFIIGEEFQNAETEQIIMFVSRIGKNSKLVLNGDANQTDILSYKELTDFEYVINKVEKSKLKDFGIVRLGKEDIVRHPIIAPFLTLFNK